MRRVLACLSFSLILSLPVFGQAAAGVAGISGVVRDPSSGTVPNAKVVIASEGQGTIRTLNTNAEGLFIALALTPGPGYSVTVTAQGFSTYQAKDLTLQVGQNMDLQINMMVGQTTTQVEVTGVTPLVEDTKSDLSVVVDSRAIQNLPINGRRVDSFVLLTPGVSADGNFGLLTFRGVAGQNAFLVDGTDTTDQFYNENAGRTRIATQISQDAVQEFQVISSNVSAEYGRAMGGVVNTVTKSGSNQLHGTGYWFFRSTGFEARDAISGLVQTDRRNQLGGSIGGAIKKDKLFYFVNTDITRRNFPMADSLNTVAVSPVTRQWLSCGVASGSQPAATPAQCAAINNLLPRFYGQIPRSLNQELYFARMDYHVTDRNTLSASFNFLHSLSPNGIQTSISSTSGAGLTGNGDDAVTVRNGRLQWTAVPTSSFLNEFQFGIATDRQADTFDQAELGQGLGYLQVSANGTQLGPANYLPRIEPSERRFQFQDNAAWTKGTHTIKFGTDIAHTGDYVYFISPAFGSYTYQTVNAFALDFSGNTTGIKNWQRYSQAFGNPVLDTYITDYGFYVQDQWRATSRLTLNYGIRYEYAALPTPSLCNPDYPLTCNVNSSKTNLAPRIGVAYRLNNKTVLQAGYGMFYARFQGGTIDNLFTTGNGLFQPSISLTGCQQSPTCTTTQQLQTAVGPAFPNALSAIPAGISTSSVGLQMAAPNLKTPYSEQGNVGIQREVTRDLSVGVSYLWSRGLQLYGIRDLNLPTTTTNFTYTIDDTSGAAVGTYTTPVYTGNRPDSRYGAIYYDENGINSYYNALAVTVNKRLRNGFQALFSYTWSHEIDDGQSFGGSTNNLFLSGANYWLQNGNYRADKGSGTLDQRHRATLSWVWQPTLTHNNAPIYRYLVNNWQLSTITSLQAGFPGGSQTIKVNDTPVAGMFSNFTLNGTGFSTRVPWLPINNYYLPPMYRADARISKLLPFGEGDRYKLYLNFEVFNLANTYAARGFTSSQAYTEAKGVLTPTPNFLYVPGNDGIPPDGTEARRLQLSARFTF